MFLSLVFGVAVIGGFLKYREQQPAAPAPQVSETAPKHWPKKALDRAAELKGDVAKQRAEE